MKFTPALTLAAVLFCPASAFAINAVMYQPQLRDMSMTDQQWSTMLAQLKQQGIDTLVFQWSRYGDAFAGGESQHWLEGKARLVKSSGLKLVLGLAADDRFFERQNQPLTALESYFNLLRARDVAVATRWTQVLGAENIAGWYISSELDDRRWRSPDMQQAAQAWLTKTHESLVSVADKPVAVSSFFAGNMSPDGYQKWVTTLSHSGVKIWVQDGAGTGVLTPAARALYRQTQSSGEVIELFRQDKNTAHFSAEPVATAEQKRLMSIKPAAGQDRVYFSLRYLDVASGILQYRNVPQASVKTDVK
jgi:hypothetical protein